MSLHELWTVDRLFATTMPTALFSDFRNPRASECRLRGKDRVSACGREWIEAGQLKDSCEGMDAA
jgi:hypothetical protein